MTEQTTLTLTPRDRYFIRMALSEYKENHRDPQLGNFEKKVDDLLEQL